MNHLILIAMALGASLPHHQGFDGDLESLKEKGWRLSPGTALDATHAKEGASALSVDARERPRRYAQLFIPVETGKFYGAEAWVRCEDVKAHADGGQNRGAVIFLQWADHDKKWVGGGSFPSGLHGAYDWTLRKVPYTRRIPPEVGYLHVMLGIEGSGRAWFDSFRVFEVTSWDGVSLESPADGATVDVRRPLLEWHADEKKLAGGITLLSRSPEFPDDPAQTVRVVSGGRACRPPRGLEPGTWYWRVQPTHGSLDVPPSAVQSFLVADDAVLWPPDVTPTWQWSDEARPTLTAHVSPFVAADQVSITLGDVPAAVVALEDNWLTFRPEEALEPGVHEVTLTVAGPGGRGLSVTQTFCNKQPGSRVTIREDKVLLVDGEPFFPLGAYRDPSDTLTDFSGLKEAGFNVTHSYVFEGQNEVKSSGTAREYLRAAHANGLKVFLGLHRGKVRERDHVWVSSWVAELMDEPGLLTWYLMDEPAGHGVPAEVVAELAQTVRSVDPFHPTSLVMCRPRAFEVYAPACDILWNDPYPLPNRPLTMVEDWARQGLDAAQPGQPFWIVLQGHDLRFWRNAKALFAEGKSPDQPTPAQTRCMAYMALASGVNGIIWYWAPNSVYHIQRDAPEVWEGICDTVQELRGLMPYLVARRSPQDDLEVPDPLRAWSREADGKRVLALVNTTDAACDVEVDLSSLNVRYPKEVGDPEAEELAPGKVGMSFGPYEVRLYERPCLGTE